MNITSSSTRRTGSGRGCDEDGAREGTNKTDEIAHWCFDMGQIMFDTGRPLSRLVNRSIYVCICVFRRFDTRLRRGMSTGDAGVAGASVPRNPGAPSVAVDSAKIIGMPFVARSQDNDPSRRTSRDRNA